MSEYELRNYFAAQAIQSLIRVVEFRGHIKEERLQEAVKTAWHIADLMLEQRQR